MIADANQTTADEQPPAPNPAETPSPASVASDQSASATKPSEPASPAKGPEDQQSATENAEQSSKTESREPARKTRSKSFASSRRSTSESPRTGRSDSNDDNENRGPDSQDRGHARIIGRTPDGRPIVKLTSGQVVILPRRYDDNGIHQSRPRRRIYNDRPGDDYVPPSQPFNPQYDPNE